MRDNFSIPAHFRAGLDSFAGLAPHVPSRDGCKASREGSCEGLRGPAGPCAIRGRTGDGYTGFARYNPCLICLKTHKAEFLHSLPNEILPQPCRQSKPGRSCRTPVPQLRAPRPFSSAHIPPETRYPRVISPGERGNLSLHI